MKHGECSGRKQTLIYRVWGDMIQRVTNRNFKQYNDYGGRGITVIDEWRDPSVFIRWAKYHGYEKGLELDRINNNGNYEPDNCRFVTHSKNQLNRRRNINYGIEKRGGNFRVRITRNFHTYYGGSVKSLAMALNIRDKIENELETNKLRSNDK